MLNRQQLISTLPNITTEAEKGEVFRFVALRFQSSLLSAVGSFIKGGRYNVAQRFEAFYTSGSPITALKEINFLINTPSGVIPFPNEPLILLSLTYKLDYILDLTNANNQQILQTNVQELTGNFAVLNSQGQIAPTQELGQVAYDLNEIQALKVPSARDTDINAYNLVIFLDRLDANSYIEVYDPTGTINLKLP